MNTSELTEQGQRTLREQLLSGIDVTQQRLQVAGVSTAVLEGGAGRPVVLLHGPAGNVTHWAQVIPDLVRTHLVIAPDLPGQGASEVVSGVLDADHVIAWLGELIEHTCPSPPVLVGYSFGGAIAARFASDRGAEISQLVLVDALGLRPFEPAADFARALHDYLADPNERTHDGIWRYCVADLDNLRARMGERWELFRAYNLEATRTPGVQAGLSALMEQFGVPAIPPGDLARIEVDTTLIWGRRDLATPLALASAASARYGWRLHVIENAADDPPVEAPEAFLRALRTALDRTEQP